MILGTNLDTLNSHWLDGYVIWNRAAAQSDVHALKAHLGNGFGALRTLLWVMERDDPTQGLHIPLTASEALAINRFVEAMPLPVELAFAPLWEALWKSEDPDWKPDCPYEDPGELAQAFINSLSQLKPMMAALDIYNEFVATPAQVAVMTTWYPAALKWCRAHGIRSTVSTIIDNGDPSRAYDAYDWLDTNGGLPDFLEVHINGTTNWKDLGSNLESLRLAWGLPLTIGECDVDEPDWAEIYNSGAQYFFFWSDLI